MNAEGWYQDPFGVHELRWFSVGTPTDLVRDADVDAYDAPPEPSWDGDLTAHVPPPLPEEEAGGDLLRSGEQGDDLEPYDPTVITDAALDRGATSGLGFT